MEITIKLLIWLWPKPTETSCPSLVWMETFISHECPEFVGVESAVRAHRILVFRRTLYRLKGNEASWSGGPVTILTILLISPAVVLLINSKICIAWSVFGLLISGQKKFFPLLQISWLASLLMKHSYGGFIFTSLKAFLDVMGSLVSPVHHVLPFTYVTGKTFCFNCPTCHCKLPLNTGSWMGFGKKIQIHCTESKIPGGCLCCSNFHEDEALLRVPWGRPSLDCYHWFAGEVKGYTKKNEFGIRFFH